MAFGNLHLLPGGPINAFFNALHPYYVALFVNVVFLVVVVLAETTLRSPLGSRFGWGSESRGGVRGWGAVWGGRRYEVLPEGKEELGSCEEGMGPCEEEEQLEGLHSGESGSVGDLRGVCL